MLILLAKHKLIFILVLIILTSSTIGVLASDETEPTHLNGSSESTGIEICIEDTTIEYIDTLPDTVFCIDAKELYPNCGENILDGTTVSWSVSDTKIAEIMDNGCIIPKAAGNVTIFANYQGLEDSLTINIAQGSIQKIWLSQSQEELIYNFHKLGSQNPYNLYAIAETTGGNKYDISGYKDTIWTSDDESVATVSDGFVTTICPGKTRISVTFSGKSDSATIKVTDKTIKSASKKIHAANDSEILVEEINEVVEVSLIIDFTDGTEEDATKAAAWESADENIATVCEGMVYGVSEGTTMITATFEGYSQTFVVEVIQPQPTTPSTVFP